MTDVSLLRTLNQKPIVYYPIYRQLTKSLPGAILLSQLMYWFSKKDKIYKTNADIEKETGLTLNEMKAAKNKIKNLSFITVTREGIPAKTYYEIDWILYEETLKNSVSLNSSNYIATNSSIQLDEIHQSITENTTENTNRDKLSFSKEKHKRGLCKTKLIELDNNEIDSKNEIDEIELQIDDVLEHWFYAGGKIHQSECKGLLSIKNMIHELLIDGHNPYGNIVDDSELKFKKWTVDEIKNSIDYYANVLKKDISKTYFNEFILIRYFAKKFKTKAPDTSPLVDCFINIKDNSPTKESEKLKNKLGTVMNGTPVSQKVFIKASKYLSDIDLRFKVTDGACTTLRKNMMNVFARYIEEKKNDFTWKLEYIGSNNFRDEFLDEMLKRNVIQKKKAKRVQGEIVYY